VGTFCKNMNEYIYQAGKIAAREAIPQILACLEKKAAEKRQQCEFEGYNFPNYISEDTENVEEL
jgi:type IV secretory pathway VirB9-like protein